MELKNTSIGFSVLVLIALISYSVYVLYNAITGELILNTFYYGLIVTLTLICLFTLGMICNVIGDLVSSYISKRKDRWKNIYG